MKPLEWNRDLSIPGGKIDREHREWIGLANRPTQTDAREQSTRIAALQDLIHCIYHHFSDEKALLEKMA